MKRTVVLFLLLTSSIISYGGSVNPRFDSLEQIVNTDINLTPEEKTELYRNMLISINIIGPVADSILQLGLKIAEENDLTVAKSHLLYFHMEHWRTSSFVIPDSAKVFMKILDSIAIAMPEFHVCKLNALGAKIVYYVEENGRPDADNAKAISYVEERNALLKSIKYDKPDRELYRKGEIAGGYIRLAQLWEEENRIDKAVQYYNNVLKMPEKFSNKKIALMNIPDLYGKLHDWENMKKAASSARDYLKSDFFAPFADIYAILRLGKAELKLNNLEEAEKLAQEGWAQLQGKKFKRYEDEMLKFLMEVYFVKGEIDKVKSYAYEKVENRNPIFRAGALAVLGKAYNQEGAFKKAEQVCQESIQMLNAVKRFPELVSNYKMASCTCLGQAYQALGNSAKSNQYLNQYIDLKDKYDEDYLSIVSKAVNQIEIDKQEALLIAQAEKAAVVYENKLYYFKSIAGIITGFLLMLSFAFWKLRKKNGLINIQKQAISDSLQEKELLLKEIHHRVKNNLQVVSSLLRLQSNYIKDSTALSAINEGRNRVKSMALIHQDLYQEENFSGIKVQSYFNKLLKNVFNTYNVSDESISLETDIEDVIVDVDTIVPLGLIFNELISNSLKYAFDESGGIIKVSFKEIPEVYQLNIEDNGSGFDEGILHGKSESFGFQMVHAFVKKLNAKMTVDSNLGTNILISIPKVSNG